MPPEPPTRFRDIEVERVLVREPRDGRVRAVLECCPPLPPATGAPVPAVRLSLLGPDGQPRLVLDVDDAGEPTIHVGPVDAGTTVVITRNSVDAWHLSNVVAALRSTDDGGCLELRDAKGKTVVELPGKAMGD